MLFGGPPLHESPLAGPGLHACKATSFDGLPGVSILSSEPTALASLTDLPATASVSSMREVEAELGQGGWTTEGSLGEGASLLARDPDGNVIDFVKNAGGTT